MGFRCSYGFQVPRDIQHAARTRPGRWQAQGRAAAVRAGPGEDRELPLGERGVGAAVDAARVPAARLPTGERDETFPVSTEGWTRRVHFVRERGGGGGGHPQSQAAACGKACGAARSSHRTDACSRAAPSRRQRAGPAGSLRPPPPSPY